MFRARFVAAIALALMAMLVIIAVLMSQKPRVRLSRPRTIVAGTNAPITLRYIKTGEFNNGGYISFGTTLWATNHTSRNLSVTLSAIEVKTAAGWTTRTNLLQPLSFVAPGKPFGALLLQPHAVGYACLKLGDEPSDETWRLRAAVGEQMSVAEGAGRRIKLFPYLLNDRRRGDTNTPVNPFSTKISIFRDLGNVVSQEISPGSEQ